MHNRINGQDFELMLQSGLANLVNHEKELNDMNVYPVPDGDTGTNMRLTLSHGVDDAQSDTHVGRYLKQVASGMLLGARGNSGVILSQLFNGIALEFESKSIVDVNEMRDALLRAYRTAYGAVERPVEGTILTVAREGIENARSQIYRGIGMENFLSIYVAEMRKSLKNTPELLPRLKEAGVLDSGASGYIYIVDGMLSALFGDVITISQEIKPAGNNFPGNTEDDEDFEVSTIDPKYFTEDSTFEYGYCMEFLLRRMNKKKAARLYSLDKFKDALKIYGESIVAVEDGTIVKVHVHTKDPARIILLAQEYGEFISFKLENMQLQNNAREDMQRQNELATIPEIEIFATGHEQLAKLAVVEGTGVRELYEGLGISALLSGGQSMNTSAESFVNAIRKLDADNIVIFPNNKNIYEAARQAKEILASELGNISLEIIPTCDMVQGYYALAMDDLESSDIESRINAMKDGADICTISVSKAVRNAKIGDTEIQSGKYMSFISGKFASVDSTMCGAVYDALQNNAELLDGKGVFIVLRGQDMTDEDEEKLTACLEEKYPDMSVSVINGGQHIFPAIIGLA